MLNNIDITMTVALRPEIVEPTLKSLLDNVVWHGSLSLIADIAPVGIKSISQAHMSDLLFRYFPNANIRVLPESKQADAVRWTWNNVSSEYFLHWEDDWVLLHDIDLSNLIGWMDKYPNCAMLLFDRLRKSVVDYVGYEGKFKKIDNYIYEKVIHKGLGGPPALIRKSYATEVVKLMDANTCLDNLSATSKAQDLLDAWTICAYTGDHGGFVDDIGKAWRKKMGIRMIKVPQGVLPG